MSLKAFIDVVSLNLFNGSSLLTKVAAMPIYGVAGEGGVGGMLGET